jgi:uncharacterized protein with GYD domain
VASKVAGHYWTQGRHDLVTIVEAPNDEAIMSGLLASPRPANFSSETMRAFTDEEMQRILG